jgi:hypothetical protein
LRNGYVRTSRTRVGSRYRNGRSQHSVNPVCAQRPRSPVLLTRKHKGSHPSSCGLAGSRPRDGSAPGSALKPEQPADLGDVVAPDVVALLLQRLALRGVVEIYLARALAVKPQVLPLVQ